MCLSLTSHANITNLADYTQNASQKFLYYFCDASLFQKEWTLLSSAIRTFVFLPLKDSEHPISHPKTYQTPKVA